MIYFLHVWCLFPDRKKWNDKFANLLVTFTGQELLGLLFITNLACVEFQIYSVAFFICLFLSPLELPRGNLEDYTQLRYRLVSQFYSQNVCSPEMHLSSCLVIKKLPL